MKYRVLVLIIAVMITDPCILRAQPQSAIELDINEASLLALKNNFDIQVYRLDRSISEKELLKAQAVYDTNLNADYGYDEDRLDSSLIIFGTRTTTVTETADLTKTLPTGTILSLGAQHFRQASNSAFDAVNPYHESTASISITQPLGKNAFGIIDRNNVKITNLNVENTVYTSLDKIESELGDSQKAYWQLLLANELLALTKDMLVNTERLYEANKENFELGTVEPPEFYATEADLRERQRDVLAAEDYLNSSMNQVRFKLNLEKDTVVKPKDEFNYVDVKESFEDLMKTALENRRDYKSARNTVKAMALSVELKKSALWPEIDLKGTLKKNGVNESFNESIKEISTEDNPEYALEIVFSFPLENSSARAEYSQQELEKVKALVNLKKIECLILVQVHDAYVHARRMYETAKLLEDARDLQHKKYLGEEARFMRGRSDTDRLIRYQHNYLTASVNYLKVLYDYKASIIDLKTAMNMLLQKDEA